MKIAIMQPTFLPWIGYFSMMNFVDTFVLLDDVQFDKRSWQQRNRILSSTGPLWITIPIITKNLSKQKINEARILYEKDFVKSMIKTIESNYVKARYFEDYSDEIFKIFKTRPQKLSTLTINLILLIKDFLDIKTNIILSSEIKAEGKKDKLLANISEQLQAKVYVSPPSSSRYLDESDEFKKKKIKVEYFQFQHPVYSQMYEKFEPHMSVIDLLFNCGLKSKTYLTNNSNSKIN